MNRRNVFTCLFVVILILSSCSNEYNELLNGQKYYTEGKYLKAEKAYKKAIEYNPDNIGSYLNLGVCYQFGLKDNKKAINTYLEGLKIDSTDFDINLNLMQAYFMDSQLDKGLMLYKKLPKINNDNFEYSIPKEVLSNMLFYLDYNEKIDLLRQFLNINPTDAGAAYYLIKFKSDKLSPELYKYISKIKYEHSENNKYSMAENHFNLGIANYEFNQMDESLKFFKLAKEEGYPVLDEIFELFK